MRGGPPQEFPVCVCLEAITPGVIEKARPREGATRASLMGGADPRTGRGLAAKFTVPAGVPLGSPLVSSLHAGTGHSIFLPAMLFAIRFTLKCRSLSAVWLAAMLLSLVPGAGAAPVELPPLPVEIQDAAGKAIARARIYPNYVEVLAAGGRPGGAIGVVMVEGRARLFVVRRDAGRTLVGWAEGRRLFNAKGALVGYYHWTPIWSYVYDKELKKVGQAQCLAYQGVCAAGVAGFLLGLL